MRLLADEDLYEGMQLPRAFISLGYRVRWNSKNAPKYADLPLFNPPLNWRFGSYLAIRIPWIASRLWSFDHWAKVKGPTDLIFRFQEFFTGERELRIGRTHV